eukprot:11043276-Ditylum_brightwellii.AAC.1
MDKYFKATAPARNIENNTWPQQPPPKEKNQKLWNKALKDTVCNEFKQLHEPLEDCLTEDINWGERFDTLNLIAYRREKTI